MRSQFNIKDPIPKKHNQDIIYHTVCPKDNCNKDFIGECERRLEERTSIENNLIESIDIVKFQNQISK